MKGFLIASFFRDFILLAASCVVVSSTFFVSFLEALLSHVLENEPRGQLVHDLVAQPMLVMYYLVLAVFVLVSVVLLVYFIGRLFFELAVAREGPSAERSALGDCCCVRGLRGALFVAFFALFALFACFWIFWGGVLATAYATVAQYLEMMEAQVEAAKLPLYVRQGAERVVLIVVFFLVAVSLNILLVMRAVFNKLVLLGSNLRGQVNRVSLFRVRPVDLTRVGKHVWVFRQLWVSFLFDSLELVTLAVWLLYPLFVAVVWAFEERCLTLSASHELALGPLFVCLVEARTAFLGVGLAIALSLAALLVLYFLRFLEERSLLLSSSASVRGPPSCRLTHIGPFAVIYALLFLLACASSVISLAMLAKPFFASLPSSRQVPLAYPGLVLLSGSLAVLFYLAKKVTFAAAIHMDPRISFFFEGACSLSGIASVNNLAPAKGQEDATDEPEEVNMYSPLYDEETILY